MNKKNIFKDVIGIIIGIVIVSTTICLAEILLDSSSVNYNNSVSMLNATTVQDAIDEIYKKTIYTINFNNNGGTGTMDSITCRYGYDCELPANTFTNTDSFKGWSTVANGIIKYQDEDTVVDIITNSPNGNITLYAVWNITYNVVFTSSDTTNCPLDQNTYQTISNVIEGNVVNNTAIPNPTCTGYDFTGWVLSGDYDSSTAKYGTVSIPSTEWTNYNFGTYFKDLSSTGGTVTLTATFDLDTAVTGTKVKYYANGGVFTNNKLINRVGYQKGTTTVTKYSHTSNVDDTGLKNSDYGNSWTNANITGTDRGDTSKAHVITIDGATSLTVDVYYNGESISYDWVTVWAGSHPDYTAASNYSSGVSGGTQLGGSQSGSYTVNGNSLTSMGHSTFTISGDTVTFGFKSDGSVVGNGYGYYAIVTATVTGDYEVASGTYEEPTKNGLTFVGWYNSMTPTVGDEFNIENLSSDTSAYAGYGYTVTFNGNGNTGGSMSVKGCLPNQNCTLPKNTFEKTGYRLVGWSEVQDGSKVYDDEGTININQNKILYAVWEEAPSICVRATTLRTNGGKTFGTLAAANGSLAAGVALDCDLNGNGTYDERFYYVSDYYDTSTTNTFNSDIAVLIYYTNVSGGTTPTTSMTQYAYYGTSSSYNNYSGPSTSSGYAYAQLPTTSQWTNLAQWNGNSLSAVTRQIRNESGGTTSGNGSKNLPTFTYTNKAARFLTAQELSKGCNNLTIGSYTTGELDVCSYLMDNTYYANSTYTYGWWLETPRASYSDYVWGVYGFNRYVNNRDAYNGFGVRPAIEVLKSNIDMS